MHISQALVLIETICHCLNDSHNVDTISSRTYTQRNTCIAKVGKGVGDIVCDAILKQSVHTHKTKAPSGFMISGPSARDSKTSRIFFSEASFSFSAISDELILIKSQHKINRVGFPQGSWNFFQGFGSLCYIHGVISYGHGVFSVFWVLWFLHVFKGSSWSETQVNLLTK